MPKHLTLITFFFSFLSLLFSKTYGYTAENMMILPCEYYGEEEVDGALSIGKVVTARDPDGTLIGHYTVSQDGIYGFMSTSGDDPLTAEDEGAVDGDIITFYIDGVQQQQQALWKSGDIAHVTLGLPQDDGYYNLHLDEMPAYLSHNNDPRYSGAAVGDMILDFLVPDNTDTQEDLMAYGDRTISNNILELSELAYILRTKSPSVYFYGSTLTIEAYAQNGIINQFDSTDQNAVMKQLAHWLAFQVPDTEDGKEYVPVAAATSADPAAAADSDYEHWMSVVGIRTNVDPFPSLNSTRHLSDEYEVRDDLEIYGLYLNDPSQSGLGFHFYMSADVWTSQYFRPIASGLEAEGKYVALMEPAELKDRDLRIASSSHSKKMNETLLIPQAGVSVYIPGWLRGNQRNYLKQIAEQLKESEDFHQLAQDDYFQKALEGTTVKRCYKVDGRDNDNYTIIPFEQKRDRTEATTAAMILNNATGQFMTAFADPQADQLYRPMPWWKAYYAFRKKTGWRREFPINYWHSYKTGSPLYPGWSMVTLGFDQYKFRSYRVFTTQQYSVTPDEKVELEDRSPDIKVLYDWNYHYRGRFLKIFVFEAKTDDQYTVRLMNKSSYDSAYIGKYRDRWIVFLSGQGRRTGVLKIQKADATDNIRQGGISYVYLYQGKT
ncbi:MAG: hypothetical protein ACLFPX_05960 [Candidatus Omnitrophota bacterium]